MIGGIMKSSKLFVPVFAAMALLAGSASAATTVVQGKIIKTEGHEVPSCRTVTFKRNDNNQLMYFRIPAPASGPDNGILAVTMAALVTGLNVDVAYDPAATTGCGAEPRIQFITLIASS